MRDHQPNLEPTTTPWTGQVCQEKDVVTPGSWWRRIRDTSSLAIARARKERVALDLWALSKRSYWEAQQKVTHSLTKSRLERDHQWGHRMRIRKSTKGAVLTNYRFQIDNEMSIMKSLRDPSQLVPKMKRPIINCITSKQMMMMPCLLTTTTDIIKNKLFKIRDRLSSISRTWPNQMYYKLIRIEKLTTSGTLLI